MNSWLTFYFFASTGLALGVAAMFVAMTGSRVDDAYCPALRKARRQEIRQARRALDDHIERWRA